MTKLKKCNICSNEIATNAKFCPQCGAKNKKPIYKRWWFIAIVAFIMINVYLDIKGSMYKPTQNVVSEDAIYVNKNIELKYNEIIPENEFDYDHTLNNIVDSFGKNIEMNLKVISHLKNARTGFNRYDMCTETLPSKHFDIFIPDTIAPLDIDDHIKATFQITRKSEINNMDIICGDIISFKLNDEYKENYTMKKIIIATVGGILLFGSGFYISNIKAQNERHVKELDKLKIDLEKTNKDLEKFKKENKIEDPDYVTKEDNKDSNEKNKHEEMNQILKDNRTLRDQQFKKEDQEKKKNHNNSKPVHKEKPIKPELPNPPSNIENTDNTPGKGEYTPPHHLGNDEIDPGTNPGTGDNDNNTGVGNEDNRPGPPSYNPPIKGPEDRKML